MSGQVVGTLIMVGIAVLFVDRVRRDQRLAGVLCTLPFLAITLGAIWL